MSKKTTAPKPTTTTATNNVPKPGEEMEEFLSFGVDFRYEDDTLYKDTHDNLYLGYKRKPVTPIEAARWYAKCAHWINCPDINGTEDLLILIGKTA